MTAPLPAALALALSAMPACADEFTDTLASALKAYNDGDVTGAREDLDYAGKLLTAMKAEALAKFLPAAPAGWTKEAASDDDWAAAAASWACSAAGRRRPRAYKKDAGASPSGSSRNRRWSTGSAAMITGMAGIAGGNRCEIQRVEFTQNDDGLQGVVNNGVMVAGHGGARIEAKTAASRGDGLQGARRFLIRFPGDRLARPERRPSAWKGWKNLGWKAAGIRLESGLPLLYGRLTRGDHAEAV